MRQSIIENRLASSRRVSPALSLTLVLLCAGNLFADTKYADRLVWVFGWNLRQDQHLDEIRMGGTCAACRGRNMGELLGECITKQVRILRKHMPGVEIDIWSDMLDPHHNAHGDYYLVEGDFTGSWNHVPKDLKVAVWGREPRVKNLQFFTDQGFKTLVACYYDADNLDDVKNWLKLTDRTPGVQGLMYTPWQRKYSLLGEFGELLDGGQ